mmetsp:Transcript_51612/g.95542  ORF Transcript_51612/g.95542 Transcript_51612/m.95542 type:complete len:234 (+) Transcript_51612:517-1218(+)
MAWGPCLPLLPMPSSSAPPDRPHLFPTPELHCSRAVLPCRLNVSSSSRTRLARYQLCCCSLLQPQSTSPHHWYPSGCPLSFSLYLTLRPAMPACVALMLCSNNVVGCSSRSLEPISGSSVRAETRVASAASSTAAETTSAEMLASCWDPRLPQSLHLNRRPPVAAMAGALSVYSACAAEHLHRQLEDLAVASWRSCSGAATIQWLRILCRRLMPSTQSELTLLRSEEGTRGTW